MNELKDKFEELFKDKKKLVIVAFGLVLIILLAFSELLPSEESKDVSREENTSGYASQYTAKAEKELEEILKKISGAGKVSVMITLDSTYENVFAKGYETKIQEQEGKTQSESQEEYIIVKQDSGDEKSLIIKVYEPQIKGVAVVAQGADDIYVKQAIIETVCALYDISSAKVSVTKME